MDWLIIPSPMDVVLAPVALSAPLLALFPLGCEMRCELCPWETERVWRGWFVDC